MSKYPNLDAELVRCRKDAADVADVWGCTVQTVRNRLNDRNGTVSVDDAVKLGDMLGVDDLRYLFETEQR